MTATKTRTRLERHDFNIGGKLTHSYTLDCTCKRYTAGDPHKVPGVTTILSALPGPPPSWGADMAAKAVTDEWDRLADMPVLERYEYLKGAPDRYMNQAADRGSRIHKLGEQLVFGEAPEVPDELRGPVEAYARFLDLWEIEPVAVETPVALTQARSVELGLGAMAVAGTADLWARIGKRGNALALIDAKTGNSVQNKTGLQLAGYRYADLWHPDGPESETTDKPDVDLLFVAHIGPDDVRMLPVVGGLRELKYLAYLRMSMRWQQDHDWWYRKRGPEPLIGEAVQP
jgi:hypothetical protein